MRALLIKNNTRTVKAVTEWDGVSHINVPKNHTLVLSDNKDLHEDSQVDIAALKAQQTVDAQARADAQEKAEADSQARRIAAAQALTGKKSKTETA